MPLLATISKELRFNEIFHFVAQFCDGTFQTEKNGLSGSGGPENSVFLVVATMKIKFKTNTIITLTSLGLGV